MKKVSVLLWIGIVCSFLIFGCSKSPTHAEAAEGTTSLSGKSETETRSEETTRGKGSDKEIGEEGTSSEEKTSLDLTSTKDMSEDELIRYRIEKLKELAQVDASKAEKKDLDEAANYVKDHYNNCYDDSRTMENMIYYGYVLFYRFGDGSTIGDMGHSGATAAELVYTKTETADSPTVKAYKEDVEACIDELLGKGDWEEDG